MSVYANKCLPMPPYAVYIFWWNENLRFKLNKFPRDLPRIHFRLNMILEFSLSCEIVNEIFITKSHSFMGKSIFKSLSFEMEMILNK